MNNNKNASASNRRMSIFMSVGMAFFMSLGMSLVMTLVNAGFSERFLLMWLRAWCIGFLVALPLSFAVPVFLRRLAATIGIAGPPNRSE